MHTLIKISQVSRVDRAYNWEVKVMFKARKKETAIVIQPNQTRTEWKVIKTMANSTYSPWAFSVKGVITRLQSYLPEPKWRSCKVPVRTRLKTKISDFVNTLILPYHIEGSFSLLKLLYDTSHVLYLVQRPTWKNAVVIVGLAHTRTYWMICLWKCVSVSL